MDATTVGVASPRLTLGADAVGVDQTAYQLRRTSLTNGERETAERTPRSDGVLVPWPWSPLASREAYLVSYRLWDREGAVTAWSADTLVEAPLFDPGDWVARPVGAGWPEDRGSDVRRPALVRRRFRLERPVRRARLYVTAHGLADVEVNGIPVQPRGLSTEWTSYDSRLLYRTFDVTALLAEGDNVIGAWLGDGWYRGRLAFHGGVRNLYGDDQSLIAQLEVVYDDDTTTLVATDDTWECRPSPITRSGIYDGEAFDERLFDPAWSQPGATTGGWSAVAVHHRDPATLRPATLAPMRDVEERKPDSVLRLGEDRWMVDFGQNLVGRVRLDLPARPGATVTLRHAEVLQGQELVMRPLRDARATDEYVVGDAGHVSWEPRFTYHGFRYLELAGVEDLVPDGIRAQVLHTDMERTGWFECSDPALNRLHENVVWSMRGNFVGIPTDCPNRDERLGWTGDLQLFAPTAVFLYDCVGLVDSWLTDVGLEQLPDGTVPWFVPTVPVVSEWTPVRPGAGWGDVVALTPWLLYQRTGDVEVLRRHHAAARAWVDLVERLAGPSRLWDTGFQLGDWLDPTSPPDDPADGSTDRYLVATAYFAWSARHVALAADVLGDRPAAERYAALADEVSAAWRSEYLVGGGILRRESVTGYALAIAFGLVEGLESETAGDRLAALVRADGHRISTGFLGTPVVCDALTTTGHLDDAYGLLLQRECPSWLYPVSVGATTIWERWDSLRPDGSINPGEMLSFNHYALGAVADWMHRTIGGLTPEEPAYRRFRVEPRPTAEITSAHVRHRCPSGVIDVEWAVASGNLAMSVTVPHGTTATVATPGGSVTTAGPGVHRFRERWPLG